MALFCKHRFVEKMITRSSVGSVTINDAGRSYETRTDNSKPVVFVTSQCANCGKLRTDKVPGEISYLAEDWHAVLLVPPAAEQKP